MLAVLPEGDGGKSTGKKRFAVEATVRHFVSVHLVCVKEEV